MSMERALSLTPMACAEAVTSLHFASLLVLCMHVSISFEEFRPGRDLGSAFLSYSVRHSSILGYVIKLIASFHSSALADQNPGDSLVKPDSHPTRSFPASEFSLSMPCLRPTGAIFPMRGAFSEETQFLARRGLGFLSISHRNLNFASACSSDTYLFLANTADVPA